MTERLRDLTQTRLYNIVVHLEESLNVVSEEILL